MRVALLEDGSLTELYLERQQHRGLAGNIYKGKVTRVLPGMQAAFVDIGLEKAGFLHVSDFHDDVQAVGSIAEVIGEDDVETYPVDGDADGEAKSPQDLQELAELENLEEPSERQDDRQDYRHDERQAGRPNVRQGARQAVQPDVQRRDIQQGAEQSEEQSLKIDQLDLDDEAAATSAEGEAEEPAVPAVAGEAGAPGT
ncbi:MAG: S1 RNA-binding domain-containing protein, partial [Candidatus Binataceae bacterium]